MLEVADIVREAGPAYRAKYGSRMLPSQLRAMRDIEQCRTPALGGHLRECDRCLHLVWSYHSCRNRHCPKCHRDQARRWLEKQRTRLLPCTYFLFTFTLPEELRALARSHQKRVYGILMEEAASSLLRLCADRQFLGGRPGMIAVLHTWTRAMVYHPHVHVLVTAGGLSPDGRAWVAPRRPRFLVPGYVLSVLFRKKVRRALARADLLDQAPAKVWNKLWVVHAEPAGTGQQVLDYFARYLFRIAIANSRLERFEGGQVTFRYRDNRSHKVRRCTLTAQEFLHRFFQHVLPRRFSKIRHYGLMSPSRRRELERARALLHAPPPEPAAPAVASVCTGETSPATLPQDLCPRCRLGIMRILLTLPRTGVPP